VRSFSALFVLELIAGTYNKSLHCRTAKYPKMSAVNAQYSTVKYRGYAVAKEKKESVRKAILRWTIIDDAFHSVASFVI
jgi:hypothetical protein